ncbi:MAG: large-conductance mechanosensitive channel [Methanoregula sp. PtaU1.Bin051]|nr:MAG: large-conductance mechanosensitive channel [Methanoregula sp. PtaU1.Bin051]
MASKDLNQAEKLVGEGVRDLTKGARGFQEEFMEFLRKYQVIGLAVAFVIGAAATKLVTAVVSDVIMPVIAVIMPQGDWRTATLDIGPVKFLAGDMLGNIIDFVIIALAVFLIVKYIMKGDTSKKI